MIESGAHFDFIVIGSGFGGSVSALRLAEKGYRVLVLEQGAELSESDFPRSNWNIARWLWLPFLGFRGILELRPFRDVLVMAGVGVGGGSLGYAATLPRPPREYFGLGHWATLADWERELEPHYRTASQMLGAAPVRELFPADRVLQQVAREVGQEAQFSTPNVGIYFGHGSEATATDPYFGGEGPVRRACTHCGGCMTGCRVGAKNSLDKNYLFLARKRGTVVSPNTKVIDVFPREGGGRQHGGGYEITARRGRAPLPLLNEKVRFSADQVVFSAGALGSVELLLRLKARGSLPDLSDRLGRSMRTNSESLIGVITQRRDLDMSRGVAIGSLLQTDAHSHVEVVRYAAGSGLWRLFALPHLGAGIRGVWRPLALVWSVLRQPLRFLRASLVPDHARSTAILLYMRTLDGTLRFRLRRGITSLFRLVMGSTHEEGERPMASLPEATDLAQRYARHVDGLPVSLAHETLLNVPTTAHILGGCCMGADAERGVVDDRHRGGIL